MYFILLLLCLIALVAVAAFCEPVAVSFYFDTNQMDMHAVIKWIPFIRLEGRIVNYRLQVTVFIFRRKLYAGFIKPRKRGRSMRFSYDSLYLTNTEVKVSYGFSEPYLTGLFSAAADFAAALIRSAEIELTPAFLPENEFLVISATTKLNIGRTLIKMLTSKSAIRRKNYGPA